MRIDLTGTNIEINGELRALVAKRFAKIKRRVPEDVRCDVILAEEHNPKIADGQKAEANLHIKGGTINAKAHERDMAAAVGRIADEVVRQLNRRGDRARAHSRAGSETIRHSHPQGAGRGYTSSNGSARKSVECRRRKAISSVREARLRDHLV